MTVVFEGSRAIRWDGGSQRRIKAVLTNEGYTPMRKHESLADIPRSAIVAGPIAVECRADVERGVTPPAGINPHRHRCMHNVFYEVLDNNKSRLIFSTSAHECASSPGTGKEHTHGQYPL